MYREILLDRQRLKKIAREYGLINNASALINKHRIEQGGNFEEGNKLDLQIECKKRRRDDDNSYVQIFIWF